MKKVFACVLLGILSIPFGTYAKLELSGSCEYKGDFDRCMAAQTPGTTREIDDFVCIASSEEYNVLGQIILDKKFKDIDKEIEEYIFKLEEAKDYYFGQNAQKPFLDGLDDINELFKVGGVWYNQYMKICDINSKDGVIHAMGQCMKDGTLPDVATASYFTGDTVCEALVKQKLRIAENIAHIMLPLNKIQVQKDENKKHQQKERDQYDKLLQVMMENIGYIERVWKKWPSKTKDAKGH